MNQNESSRIDWVVTVIPFVVILALCFLFLAFPTQSNSVISQVRFFMGDSLGLFYLLIGLGIFIASLIAAFSRVGRIVLGNPDEKPKYSFFAWGSMMFTAGLAADILFYSFSEWILYATDSSIMSSSYRWELASVYPLFHWSFIPWGFYLMLAVAFGFMLHVRNRSRQRFSEACRPILGNLTDGIAGRIIDLLAVFALIAGTATTFSLATPLMANMINELFRAQINEKLLTIIILIITCIVYTYSLLHGMKGIKYLAKGCIYLFFFSLIYILLFGGETRFILENGFESFGLMLNDFLRLSTTVDPFRESSFPQNWTIFYWAYWMVWSVATPFFIGNISRGRTVRQTILGGYIFGVGATLSSFIVLGNYALGKQLQGVDFISKYLAEGNLYHVIIEIINSVPLSSFMLVLILITMIAFYATSFDSIAFIASCYSYKKLKSNESPNKIVELAWCILLILLPIALVFSSSSMSNLQSVSIIAAFPLGIVIILITVSFFRDIAKYLKEMDLSNVSNLK